MSLGEHYTALVDALATYLAGREWPIGLTVERAAAPSPERATLSEPTLYVWPGTLKLMASSRARDPGLAGVAIALAAPLGQMSPSEYAVLTPLLETACAIVDGLDADCRLPTTATQLVEVTAEPLYDHQRWLEAQLFLAPVLATYQVAR